MKPKNYWDTETDGRNPFELPRRISQGLNELARTQTVEPPETVVRYLWIFVTEDGIERRRNELAPTDALQAEDWLNVIDEAAALGAEWMVVHVGGCLCQCPELWKLCEWAQQQHALRVGIHLSCASLSEDDVERLGRLDKSLTYLIGDGQVLDGLRPLRDLGIQCCEATVRPEDRMTNCTNPEELLCVGIDGRLFTCGLVLGDRNYALGNVLEHGVKAVLSDATLPHAVTDTTAYYEHGCDGCPPHVAHRITAHLAK